MKDSNIMLRVSTQLKEKIRNAAESEGKAMTEWILDLVKKELSEIEAMERIRAKKQLKFAENPDPFVITKRKKDE